LDEVRKIIASGVDVNSQRKSGFNPLTYAAHNNHLAVAQLLIEHGANAKLAALALAEKSNSPELAAYLKARC
jgi:ankyrin repeat protein